MYILIFITTKNKSEANKIAKALLKDKLIACSNIVTDVQSFFWWGGKIDKASEVLLMLKTKKSCFRQIEKIVKKLHSYSVPEIIALPIAAGNQEYLKWINESLK